MHPIGIYVIKPPAPLGGKLSKAAASQLQVPLLEAHVSFPYWFGIPLSISELCPLKIVFVIMCDERDQKGHNTVTWERSTVPEPFSMPLARRVSLQDGCFI